LPVEPGRGFERLPRSSSGDVMFDIEGDPFWEPARGLHFLFGLLTEDAGAWRYRTIWAHDRAGERQAFEALVDFFHERLAQRADMHVYHYGAYEPAALKQLMGVYATREDAVDALLRGEVFVDLHSVVRQGLRAGVPGYSLKDVEALPAFRRQSGVTSGTRAVLARQVPGARGSRGLLLDGHLERRGRATHPRLPLLPQSPQRRRLARDVPGLHRRQPAPPRVTRARSSRCV